MSETQRIMLVIVCLSVLVGLVWLMIKSTKNDHKRLELKKQEERNALLQFRLKIESINRYEELESYYFNHFQWKIKTIMNHRTAYSIGILEGFIRGKLEVLKNNDVTFRKQTDTVS